MTKLTDKQIKAVNALNLSETAQRLLFELVPGTASAAELSTHVYGHDRGVGAVTRHLLPLADARLAYRHAQPNTDLWDLTHHGWLVVQHLTGRSTP